VPKGLVEPREVVCRSCGEAFTTDRPGKGAWYCRGEHCESSAKRRKKYVRVADLPGYLERQAAEREAAEREREAVRAATQRRRQALRESTTLTRLIEQLEPRVRAAVQKANELSDELLVARRRLRELQGGPQVATPPPAPSSVAASVPSVAVAGSVAEIQRLARKIGRGGEPGRARLAHAVRALGGAAGVVGTREALLRVAAEALAWDASLPSHSGFREPAPDMEAVDRVDLEAEAA
jgi:hypothetical protein